MIKLGNNNIGKVYLGATQIGKAYLGNNLVYTNGPGIPDGPVDWIKSDGVAYINSGITGAAPISVSTKVLFASGDYAILGSKASSGEGRLYPVAGYGQGDPFTISMGYDYYWNIGNIGPAVVNKTPVLVHATYTSGANGQVVFYKPETDDKFIRYTHGSTANVSTSQYMGIMGYNVGGDWRPVAEGTKLYYLRIYGDKNFNTLTFDGIPYKYNGEYGLWDNVTNTFFGNANSLGRFHGGIDTYNYTAVDYIETDGVAYIDTGIMAIGKASAEIKYLAKSGEGSTQMIIGTSDGNEGDNLWGMAVSYGDKLEIAYRYFYATDGLSISDSLTNETPFIARFSYDTGTGDKFVYVKEDGEATFRGYSKSLQERLVLWSMYLFAGHNPNTDSGVHICKAGSRVYYCKIYADASYTKLAFDGIPCIYNGEYGLWDRVSNSFFGNAAGSGAFTGPSINNN